MELMSTVAPLPNCRFCNGTGKIDGGYCHCLQGIDDNEFLGIVSGVDDFNNGRVKSLDEVRKGLSGRE